jgi:hypothetical protein
MNRPRRLLLALALTLTWAVAPAPAQADHTQTSVFQDDQYLIYSSTPVVERTLATLHGLGVQQLRVNVLWSTVAPDPQSRTVPAGFDARNPADYPASGWAPYDRLAELAPLYGMQVEYNITAPGPLWAMGRHSPTARAANHWYPNALDFLYFVYAVGTRYSGTYHGLPRVSTWSIWNEPNQPGWLAPQSQKVHGHWVREAPRLYRSLVDAAYFGLYFTGHSTDTILLGETAPEGYETPGFYTAMTPMPFLRDLYCVNGRMRPLRGASARAIGCPTKGPASKFAESNPVLFHATGYAHHPYYFFHPPSYGAGDPNFAPIADTGRLERFLDGTFRAYGVRRHIPIYFTEYGYQTRPPDPFEVVTPAEQAAYLNEADYMAWRNPRVRSVAQFLLYDSGPNRTYRPNQFGYWDTFQTGLMFRRNRPKPALYAYRVPIWIPGAHARRGSRTFIWGQVRPADALPAQRVAVEWRSSGRGRYHVLTYARTGAGTGYLTARVRLPGSGYVRLGWRSPGGTVEHSRAVPVTVG